MVEGDPRGLACAYCGGEILKGAKAFDGNSWCCTDAHARALDVHLAAQAVRDVLDVPTVSRMTAGVVKFTFAGTKYRLLAEGSIERCSDRSGIVCEQSRSFDGWYEMRELLALIGNGGL